MNLKKNLLAIKDIKKTYGPVQALRGVSLSITDGETLAVVGESGCGKSTLARVLMKIEDPDSGQIEVDGKNIQDIKQKQLPNFLQMVFQDPYSSLNPRKRIKDIIAEPLKIRAELPTDRIYQQVEEVSQTVGLRPEILERYPHMLSGGQRQRVGIARALVTHPQILVCDEPVSALDVSVQAQVLNLLLDLKKNKGLSLIFISHDLGVVRFVADRIAVMYLGRIVETGTKEKVFNSPKHPYTRLLLDSSYSVSEEVSMTHSPLVASELPSPLNPPSGCGFHTRCPYVKDICKGQVPELKDFDQQIVACHLVDENGQFKN